MRILITIQHPAHVHFFRNIIHLLKAEDHEIRVYSRNRPLIATLLDHYNIEHEPLVEHTSGLASLAFKQAAFEWRLFKRARAFKPDVMTAIAEPGVPHVGTAVGARTVIWTDSGDAAILNRIGTPFADVVCTPRCLDAEYGDKQLRYDGYHELSYLHPNRFEPDPAVLRASGINPEERYFVCRFVSWEASHDVGKTGISPSMKRYILQYLNERGTVYVTSEGVLPVDLQPYEMRAPPHLIHDLMWYADLYVGDSQTMATEAAILGTPAVRSNDFAGDGDMGNFIELQEEYELLYSTADEERAFTHIKRLIEAENTPSEWKIKRQKLLTDKIDVAEFGATLLADQAKYNKCIEYKST